MTDGNQLSEEAIGDLVRKLADETKTLVRQELALAQAELQEKGKRAGIGGGLFGAAGLLSVYIVGALVATAILLLSEAVVPWLAAALVAVALAAIAGVLALVGKRQADQATPPVPERAKRSAERDVETVKERGRRYG
jgi:nitrate/nitrite transporter NarK